MAQVNFSIMGRNHAMACADGQEEHLKNLAKDLDARTNKLAKKMGAIGDSKVLIVTALMILDELQDIKKSSPSASNRSDKNDFPDDLKNELIDGLQSFNDRLSELSDKLEKSQ